VVALPAMAGLCVLAHPILGALFQGGEFTAADVDLSAPCLIAYAPTLLFQTVILLLARADYARSRHARVVRVGLIAVAVNVVLDFALAIPLGAPGVAIATSSAAVVNAVLLARGLGLPSLAWRRAVLASATPLAAVTLVMSAGVFGLRRLLEGSAIPCWQPVLGMELPLQSLCVVGLGVLVGAVLYFVLARRLARREVDEVVAVFRRRSP
jgi:putative peptidoglycan lipid II flippase